MKRRIWCELLPPEELASESTLALLERFALQPIVALPPSKETEPMFAALAKLSHRNIELGIWPLLTDEDGYWPSRHNADRFAARVRELLPRLERSKIRVQTIAFDLEPPLEVTRKLIDGGAPAKARAVIGGLIELVTRAEAAHDGDATLAALDEELRQAGIETLAAVMPTLVLDLASRSHFWEHVFKTPCAITQWSRVSPMLYTTVLAKHLPSESLDSARILLHRGAELLVDAVGRERASVSIGLVTTGKLGDEPFFPSPDELRLDVEAARAAGVDDLALFSLEGVLSRGTPEAWLLPYTRAEARAPSGARARVLSSLVRAAVWASTPLRLFR